MRSSKLPAWHPRLSASKSPSPSLIPAATWKQDQDAAEVALRTLGFEVQG